MIQQGVCKGVIAKRSKGKKMFIKSKMQEENESTKKLIKEKIWLWEHRKREGIVIIGCETGEEMKKLKDSTNQAGPRFQNYGITIDEAKDKNYQY